MTPCSRNPGGSGLALLIVAAVIFQGGYATAEEHSQEVRPAILAGSWYPGTTEALTEKVDSLLGSAPFREPEGRVVALVVPHAGYRYSGGIAARAYRILKDTSFRRVILVGPSHRPFPGISVNLQAAYETPLGRVPVDQEAARAFLQSDPRIQWRKDAHGLEHSLEIQLPFLQSVLDRFDILPVIMGQQDPATCTALAKQIAKVAGGGRDTLLLASTDLSHFHPYERARTLDRRFVSRVRDLSPEGLSQDLQRGKTEACGGGAVVAVMSASKALGTNHAVILGYANSGDVTGRRNRVVGYMSAVLVQTQQ